MKLIYWGLWRCLFILLFIVDYYIVLYLLWDDRIVVFLIELYYVGVVVCIIISLVFKLMNNREIGSRWIIIGDIILLVLLYYGYCIIYIIGDIILWYIMYYSMMVLLVYYIVYILYYVLLCL